MEIKVHYLSNFEMCKSSTYFIYIYQLTNLLENENTLNK